MQKIELDTIYDLGRTHARLICESLLEGAKKPLSSAIQLTLERPLLPTQEYQDVFGEGFLSVGDGQAARRAGLSLHVWEEGQTLFMMGHYLPEFLRAAPLAANHNAPVEGVVRLVVRGAAGASVLRPLLVVNRQPRPANENAPAGARGSLADAECDFGDYGC